MSRNIDFLSESWSGRSGSNDPTGEGEDKETGFISESEDTDAEGGSLGLSDGERDIDADNVV